jgi:hypothetical protein
VPRDARDVPVSETASSSIEPPTLPARDTLLHAMLVVWGRGARHD